MKTTSNKLHNTLDIIATFAVYRGRVDLRRLENNRLCWVGEEGPSEGEPLRLIIKDHLVQTLNHEGPSLEEISEAIRQTSMQIGTHLEREFGIFCDIRLNFVLEEQENQALGKFAERMRFENSEETIKLLQTSCNLGDVSFVDIKEISASKASKITEENFSLEGPEISVLPGNEIRLKIRSKEPVICREVHLYYNEHQVLSHQESVHLDANISTTIRLPGIPVAMYRKLLWEQSGKLSVHLVLNGKPEAIVLSQRLQHQLLEINKSPVSLFLDVGSAFSKFMVVEITADLTDNEIDQSELTSHLRSALQRGSDGSADGIALEEPQLTQVFAEKYGLSHAPKKIIDEYDDERLAAHFARSVSGLAARFYKRENRLIADVYWAFPNTKARNFVEISEAVNRYLRGTTLGTVRIVPEAECLRSEFAGVLNALAGAAKKATRSKADAETQNKQTKKAQEQFRQAWEDYQNLSWINKMFVKFTGGKPTDPSHSGLSYMRIPSLEDWQSEFSRLKCDPQLSNFLVFDAGGYSLDVYGKFSHGFGKIISESYKAGSADIDSILVAQLRKDNPERPAQDYVDTAAEAKVTICSNPSENTGHVLFSLCKDSTSTVYGKAIKEVLTTIKRCCEGKGFPIILTGGGSQNRFLRELLQSELTSIGLDQLLINSTLLYSTMRSAGGAKSTELKLFLGMASAFQPDEDSPRMAPTTDVLGGLAQQAYKD